MHKYQKEVKVFLKNYIRNYRAKAKEKLPQEKVAEQLRISTRAYEDLERGVNGMSVSTFMCFLTVLPDENILAMVHDFHSYLHDIEQHKDNI